MPATTRNHGTHLATSGCIYSWEGDKVYNGKNLATGWDVSCGSGTVIVSPEPSHFPLASLPGLADQGFGRIWCLWKAACNMDPSDPSLTEPGLLEQPGECSGKDGVPLLGSGCETVTFTLVRQYVSLFLKSWALGEASRRAVSSPLGSSKGAGPLPDHLSELGGRLFGPGQLHRTSATLQPHQRPRTRGARTTGQSLSAVPDPQSLWETINGFC